MDRTRIALLAFISIALAPYVAACFFIHPFGDDFSYAVAGMRTELFPRLRDEYLNWNGRWASNPLLLRGPLVLGIEQGLWLYRLVPVLLMITATFGWRAFLRALLPALSSADLLLGSLLLLLLSLQVMTDLGEGLYWYTGAITYTLAGALSLFVMAFWLRAWRDEWRLTGTAAFRIGLLAVLVADFNELHMVFMVLLHALLLVVHRMEKGRWHAGIAGALVAVLAAGGVMAMAPGNAVRAAQFPMKHDALHSAMWGVIQSGRFLATWFLSPAVLLFGLLVLANARWISDRLGISPSLSLPDPRWIMASIGILVIAAMGLPYWTTGLLGQHRTVNATWLFIMPMLLVALASLVRLNWRPISQRMQWAAWTLLFVTLLFIGNGGRISADLLSGRFQHFDLQLITRYATIESAVREGSESIALLPLTDPPAAPHYMDAGSDPGFWINRSLAYYFGADDVPVKVEAPQR